MKTQELDVYLSTNYKEFIDGDRLDLINMYSRQTSRETVKAKLIISLPEKKITITESEFDEACGEVWSAAKMMRSVKTLKHRLGFTDDN